MVMAFGPKHNQQQESSLAVMYMCVMNNVGKQMQSTQTLFTETNEKENIEALTMGI